MTRSALERSSLHRVWTRDLCGRDFRWWLLRQIELEATEEEFQVRFGLGVAGQEQLAAIAGGDLDVDHMDRGEFLEGAMRCRDRGRGCAERESTRNRGAARAAAANGAGWTLLAGMAGYKGVNRSWSVLSRIRVRGCRSLSCPTVSGALAAPPEGTEDAVGTVMPSSKPSASTCRSPRLHRGRP